MTWITISRIRLYFYFIRSKAVVEVLLRHPKHSQMLYRPNNQVCHPTLLTERHHFFSCLLAASFLPKTWLQYLHSNGFLFKCTVLTCKLSLSLSLNLFSQKLQGKGRSSLWTLSIWILSLSERSQWNEQWGHGNWWTNSAAVGAKLYSTRLSWSWSWSLRFSMVRSA